MRGGWCRVVLSRRGIWTSAATALAVLAGAPVAFASSVDYGPISHITQGTNALFGGSCCTTRTGFDLATGWGSPMANVIASTLPR
jgi:hypothetical protein